jgi:molecular chaperone DnaJ
VRKVRRLKVNIPAGIESGKRISIPGQGDAGSGGEPAGDLYVYITVRPHEYFERNGNDLYCLVPISITQASLGSEILVSTLEDGHRVRMKIPPGTQTGRVFRLKNEGVPYLHNPERRGDLFVKVLVQVPTKLSSRARSLLQELAGQTGEEESPKPVRLSDIH